MRFERAAPVLALLFLLAACSSRRDEELIAVKSARSVAAEWAAVEQLAARSRLTSVYAAQIREQARDELKSDRQSLHDPNAPAAREVDAIRNAASPSAARLRAAARTLDEAGKSLEIQ